MAVILSLECATGSTSVALHRNGQLVGQAATTLPRAASAQLMPLVDQVLNDHGITPQQLAAVAVSSGPGSYTGLRIGAATAKGICYALAVPLLAVNTLEVLSRAFLAAQTVHPDQLLCPMIDARRMEVYNAVYDAALRVVQPTGAHIITPDSFQHLLTRHIVYFFGDGADKCRPLVQHAHARFVSGVWPHARYMGEPAFQKWQQGQVEAVDSFEPLYLKEFIAKKPKAFF